MELQELETGGLIIDSNGLIIDANNRASSLLGVPLIGELWSKIYINNFNIEASGLYYSINGGIYVSLEINKIKDKQLMLISDCTKLIDIIEAKAKTMRLKALGEMAGSISHQIKTPLAIASLQTELLQDEIESVKLDKIINNLDEIKNLLDEMLIFSTDNNVEAINSLDIINELKKQFPEVKIKEGGDNVGFVGNSKMITNMFTNIINNTIETGVQNPNIQIRSKIIGSYCRLIYTDDCGGVADKIDIFARNQSSKRDGHGIGMNVVKFIVEAHGGYIKYEKKLGLGIAIDINIPLEKSIQSGDGNG